MESGDQWPTAFYCNLQSQAQTHIVLVIGLYKLLGNRTTLLVEPPRPFLKKIQLLWKESFNSDGQQFNKMYKNQKKTRTYPDGNPGPLDKYKYLAGLNCLMGSQILTFIQYLILGEINMNWYFHIHKMCGLFRFDLIFGV